MTLPAPTLSEEAQLAQAIIAEATRLLLLAPAGLGLSGEMSEFGGAASVRPPHGILEVLYGLHLPEWEVEDLAALVSVDDVIRAGLMVEPSTFPGDRIGDVQRAIDAGAEITRKRLWGAFGVA